MKELPAYLCNRCGVELDLIDEINDFSFEKRVGYGSKHDLEHISLHLCCHCFDELLDLAIQSFKFSPVVGCDAAAPPSAMQAMDETIPKAG